MIPVFSRVAHVPAARVVDRRERSHKTKALSPTFTRSTLPFVSNGLMSQFEIKLSRLENPEGKVPEEFRGGDCFIGRDSRRAFLEQV
mmetsp:Transcript_68010/g.136844  ORF Transcript_68010/g.136844 Transcript_68010/m.136844 type:complete len:87 (-) Transcript_68010:90-350(-)